MEHPTSQIQRRTDQIRECVKQSKGWWRRIAKDSGCSVVTLERLAREAEYDPKASELAKIEIWFLMYGVKSIGPQGKQEWQLKASLDQIDAFPVLT